MIIYILIALLVLIVLFIYCACVISSMCSREEEKYEKEIKKNKMGMD